MSSHSSYSLGRILNNERCFYTLTGAGSVDRLQYVDQFSHYYWRKLGVKHLLLTIEINSQRL